LVDPEVEVRPTKGQVDDLVGEINLRTAKKERVLVTTLTKRMSEDLSDYLKELGIKVHYLHSEVETLERIAILRDLRLGVHDVIVGINLLREGLDLPEVSLVAILDADKEGFLRSSTSLVQTIGRAARNANGRVIMYADRITDSMKFALDETNRRREKQTAYNKEHGIVPISITKAIRDITDSLSVEARENLMSVGEEKGKYKTSKQKAGSDMKELEHMVVEMERSMKEAAKNLEFEKAASFRDEIYELKALIADGTKLTPWEKLKVFTDEK
jgi:excinuclease ABC subunit B